MGWFRELDDLLRGLKTAPQRLADGRVDLPLRLYMPLAVGLGASYGFFMGWYSLFIHGADGAWRQVAASMIKLPALFLLTLLVTFPSLYVFNALLGSRLGFGATLRLLVGAIVVNVSMAAALGPILGFFTVSTTSYPFMIVINVALLSIAGFAGLWFLLGVLRRLASEPSPLQPLQPMHRPDGGAEPAGENMTPPVNWQVPDDGVAQARSIFRVWVIIFGLVGAQMGWLLRPFIGSPELPFAWFRVREGNFFMAVANHLRALLNG